MIDDDVEPLGQTQMHSSHQINQQHHGTHNVNHQPHQPQQPQHQPPVPSMPHVGNMTNPGLSTELMSSSDSSSESSYSSDSDSSNHSAPSSNAKQQVPMTANLLKEDLCLSDSNSDSD